MNDEDELLAEFLQQVESEESAIRPYKKSYTLSSLDKLPWQKKIELQLWICVRTKGMYGRYSLEVDRLEDCVKENFFGVDFEKPIQENTKRLNQEIQNKMKEWITDCDNGMYYHPKTFEDLTFKDQNIIKRKRYFWYWHQRFICVRKLLAKHRGLLWGTTQVPGGKQMPDPE